MIRLMPQNNQDLLFLEQEPIDLLLDRLDPYEFTPREKEVMGWAIQCKSNPEISQILGTSPLTVQKQFGSIYQKPGVENCTGAVAIALEIMRLAREVNCFLKKQPGFSIFINMHVLKVEFFLVISFILGRKSDSLPPLPRK